jgi:hypothetical protein
MLKKFCLLFILFLVSCWEEIPIQNSPSQNSSKKKLEVKETKIITGIKDTIEIVQSRNNKKTETDFKIENFETRGVVLNGATKYKNKIFMTSRDTLYIVENSKIINAVKKTRNSHHIDLDSVCIRLKWGE